MLSCLCHNYAVICNFVWVLEQWCRETWLRCIHQHQHHKHQHQQYQQQHLHQQQHLQHLHHQHHHQQHLHQWQDYQQEEVMTPRSTSATAHSAQNWVMLISEQHRYICLISSCSCSCSFLNIVQKGGGGKVSLTILNKLEHCGWARLPLGLQMKCPPKPPNCALLLQN